MNKARIAILASGSGTTAEAFIRETANGTVAANVELVICNNGEAGIFTRVKALNSELPVSIDTRLINSSTHPDTENSSFQPGTQTVSEQHAILTLLAQYNIDLVLLLGYMKRIGPLVIDAYGWKPSYTSIYQARMVNTHPGLLPETKGLYGIHVQQHVLDKKLPEAGQSLHLVADAYDEGPTIAENRIPVLPDDTPQSLFSRVQITEKAHIGPDVHAFITEQNAFNQQKES